MGDSGLPPSFPVENYEVFFNNYRGANVFSGGSFCGNYIMLNTRGQNILRKKPCSLTTNRVIFSTDFATACLIQRWNQQT